MLDNLNEKTRKEPEGLGAFAGVIAQSRKKLKMTQEALGWALGKNQSYVRRLENGLVEPNLEVLNGLSNCLGIARERLAAFVVQGKYELDPEIVAPLMWYPKTIGELARWEMSEGHTELWIVTPEFIDLNFSDLREEVRKFLMRGGEIVFFIGQDQKESFDQYKNKIEYTDHKFSAVYVDKARLGLLTARCVIANPMAYEEQDKQPEFPKAYIMLSDENDKPVLALELSKGVALKKAEQLDLLRKELPSSSK